MVSDGSTPPDDDPYVFTPSATPGCRAPHAWLSENQRQGGSALFDHFGRWFTLLKFGDINTRDAEAAAEARGIPLKTVTAPATVRDLYEAPVTLIRPDQYVCWRGETTPDNQVWATVTGH